MSNIIGIMTFEEDDIKTYIDHYINELNTNDLISYEDNILKIKLTSDKQHRRSILLLKNFLGDVLVDYTVAYETGHPIRTYTSKGLRKINYDIICLPQNDSFISHLTL